MKKISCILVLIQFVICINAQTIIIGGQDMRNVLFRQSVKSCDEFMCRFNEKEFFPDLDLNDSLLIQKNFVFLFDYSLAKGKDKNAFLNELYEFHDSIVANNVKLNFESSNWYSELRANFIYKKRNVELGLIFKTEITPLGLPCWTLAGVNGLDKIGFSDSNEHYAISPEQHEAGFMEIDSDFKNNSKDFSKFRSYNADICSLTYFLALVESGTLTFNSRNCIIYHFFDVPSYYFKVQYRSRANMNNGWLITDYSKVSEEQKAIIIKELLGK